MSKYILILMLHISGMAYAANVEDLRANEAGNSSNLYVRLNAARANVNAFVQDKKTARQNGEHSGGSLTKVYGLKGSNSSIEYGPGTASCNTVKSVVGPDDKTYTYKGCYPEPLFIALGSDVKTIQCSCTGTFMNASCGDGGAYDGLDPNRFCPDLIGSAKQDAINKCSSQTIGVGGCEKYMFAPTGQMLQVCDLSTTYADILANDPIAASKITMYEGKNISPSTFYGEAKGYETLPGHCAGSDCSPKNVYMTAKIYLTNAKADSCSYGLKSITPTPTPKPSGGCAAGDYGGMCLKGGSGGGGGPG